MYEVNGNSQGEVISTRKMNCGGAGQPPCCPNGDCGTEGVNVNVILDSGNSFSRYTHNPYLNEAPVVQPHVIAPQPAPIITPHVIQPHVIQPTNPAIFENAIIEPQLIQPLVNQPVVYENDYSNSITYPDGTPIIDQGGTNYSPIPRRTGTDWDFLMRELEQPPVRRCIEYFYPQFI